ncbi:hypothetical protein PG996_004084 [Apiospora saccharicola]|uniref:Uncharacterized protein n=1 Tax=Apiospora saccharicola TaxID=335842 RepID=A0ABR1W6V9_9PEZI
MANAVKNLMLKSHFSLSGDSSAKTFWSPTYVPAGDHANTMHYAAWRNMRLSRFAFSSTLT